MHASSTASSTDMVRLKEKMSEGLVLLLVDTLVLPTVCFEVLMALSMIISRFISCN